MSHRVVNVERTKVDEGHVRAILDLRAQGLSLGKIAREIGISQSTVERVVRKHVVQPEGHPVA